MFDFTGKVGFVTAGATGIGAAVGFLLSDSAGWLTGQSFAVDGGHTLRQGPNLVPLFNSFAGNA